MQMTKKVLSIVLAVMMVASLFVAVPATANAAPTESLLITINSKGNSEFVSGSRTFNNIATVTFSSDVENDDDSDGWYNPGKSKKILSVAPAAGYTITKVKFYCDDGSAFDETSPFEATLYGMFMFVNGSSCGGAGVNKIEVYGYATPAHTEHTYTANPTFNWSQDANGDWNCNKLTLTCSGCDATEDYDVAGFFGASAVTCTADANGNFTYSVSKKVGDVTYNDSKTYNAGGVVKSVTQLKAAAKKGGSWELGADLTGVTDVQCADGFVLDGNGHTVTRHANVSTQAVFRTTTNPAEVTLKNLTIDGIAGQSDLKPAVATKQSNPSAGNVINLDNVKITNYDFDADNNGVVLAWGEATVNMKNCTVDTDSDYDVWGGAASTINVDGGEVGTLYLNGGTASAELTNGAVVDNFATSSDNKIKDNGDGTYSVVPKVYVAQVGENKYESLAEAITAAQDGGTVKLLADQTIDLQLAAGEEYTIDLNSYTLTVESPQNYYNYIYGDLTIDDSSAAKTGQVVVDDYGIAPRAGGKVTVNSGSFTTANGYPYLIYLMGGELEVNGGTFTAVHPVNCYASGNTVLGGTVVINDGEFTSTEDYVISGFENSNITINGGSFTGPNPVFVGKASKKTSGFTPASATINAGTFTATNDTPVVGCAKGTSVVIKGGTFTDGELSADSTSEISVSGGTFDSAVPEEFCANGFEPKDNGNGTYGVTEIEAVAAYDSNGNLVGTYTNIDDAIEAAGDGCTVKLVDNLYKQQQINSQKTPVTLDLNGYMINVTDGAGLNFSMGYYWNGDHIFTIKDTSEPSTGGINITPKYTGNACISDNTGRTIIVEGGTFTSTGKAVYCTGSNGSMTINGGTFNGEMYVHDTGYGHGTLAITDGTINGNLNAVDNAVIEVSGGTFDNPVPAAYCADGFIPKDNGDGTYGVKVPNYIAQVGENKYETLDEAVADAISSGNDIYLLAACNKAPNNAFSKLTVTGSDPVVFVVRGNGFYGASFAAKTDIANGAYVNTWTISGTGKNAVYTYTIKPATVMVTRANGDVIYPTSLANALNGMDSVCAKEGDTVTLLSNLTWDSAKVAIPVKYSGVTLDLNGNTLTGEKENFLQVKNDNTLTIENGTIVNTAADIVVGEGSTLNLDGATVGNINAGAGAKITFDNGAGITGDVDVPAGYKVVTDATTGTKTVVAMNLQDLADEGFGTTKTAGLGFVDTNRENINIPAKASILGVQLRKQPQNGYYEFGGISNALRFITAVDEEFLANTDIKDYGYLITIGNKSIFQTCKNTTNNVITSGDYDDDGITYFTAAIYNIPANAYETDIKVQFVFKTAQDIANDSSDDSENIGAYAVYKPETPATKYALTTDYQDVYNHFNP
ncbi:MAG: hypothetical protein VZR54_03400 [Ruminococcus sp.]|nr:hypothetical protein [Ruminococcus sp.]